VVLMSEQQLLPLKSKNVFAIIFAKTLFLPIYEPPGCVVLEMKT
jgi:hypothetical protein